MELAGVEIVSDGEMRRESYSNRFATALDGVDLDNPGMALDRTGHPNPVPRVVGPVRRLRPVEVCDVEFLRANAIRRIKITLPGPFTMTQQVQSDHYADKESLAMDYAPAVNAEARDLKAAGADVVQIRALPAAAAGPGPRRRDPRDRPRARGDRGRDGGAHLFRLRPHRREKPSGYSFLGELNAFAARQVSIEAARTVDPRGAPGQDDRPRRPRPRRHGRRVSFGGGAPDPKRARIRLARERLVIAPDCG
jgi:5-methyltetrahydropteroyltriglutamate--homocysteine methyltransferase